MQRPSWWDDRDEVPPWAKREKRWAQFKPAWTPRGDTEWTDATIPLRKGFIQRLGPDSVEAWVFTSRAGVYIEKALAAGFEVPFPKACADSGEVYIIGPLARLKELVRLCGGTEKAKRKLTVEQKAALTAQLSKTRFLSGQEPQSLANPTDVPSSAPDRGLLAEAHTRKPDEEGPGTTEA